MEAESVKVQDSVLYIGSLSMLVRSLASSTYYAPITRALYDGGYAALLDRGGRSKPSTLILLREPQEDELMALTMEPESPIVSLVNRIEQLESKVGGNDIEERITSIEQKLQTIEGRSEQSGKSKK
jgi:hypothetical protein